LTTDPVVRQGKSIMSKYAFLINSDLDDAASLTNTLGYARRLDDAGHEVVVFFDGAATQWIPELEADDEQLPADAYAAVRDRGLIGGACGFCASVFDVDRSIENADIALDGGVGDHGPDVGQLADQGYQLLTVD
jgi:hypothetical protein